MSTSSVRRLKERGGGGGKVISGAAATTNKTQTPLSSKPITAAPPRPTGKENPRPTSRVRAATASSLSHQKPTIRPMARIDKSSAKAANDASEPRSRWSTSSVPRGRSSSPSEFNRVLSDLRKNNNNSSSSNIKHKKKVLSENVVEKSEISKWVSGKTAKTGMNREILEANFGNIEENGKIGGGFYGKSENIMVKSEKNRAWVVDKTEENRRIGKAGDLQVYEEQGASAVNKCEESMKVRVGLEEAGKKIGDLDMKNEENEITDVKLEPELNGDLSGEVKPRSCVDPGAKREGRLMRMESGVSGGLKEKAGKSGSGNKYPSKLHEKLAFLEGKVKRIATDIKRTKEMLDMNNPDASKLILSDIQEKISGIEKAMGNVVSSNEGKVGLEKGGDSGGGQVEEFEKDGEKKQKEVCDVKSSVKGLNVEELEARLFPHHKLLRDRTVLKASVGSLKSEQINAVESARESKVDDMLINSFDENPIALEFLASLSKENQSKVTTRGGEVGQELNPVQEMDSSSTSLVQSSSLDLLSGKVNLDLELTSDERLEDFDEKENSPAMIIDEDTEEDSVYQLNDIGRKTSTGGWFVSEGESVLLAHDDGSCSFYDITNCEEKAEYRPPTGVSPNMWRDCWIIRAPSADGCSGRYVVAASAGNSMDAGFCSWDFYTKDVKAFHVEDGMTNIRTVLAPLPNNTMHRRNTLSSVLTPENRQWWYKPCGPLIISTASCQKVVRVYDIRDGENVMNWELQKPVSAMDYSSPLQWRNRGKAVIAEAETISLWDISSLTPQALVSVSSSNRKISALHINNTDAELGGGVRQRVSSSEAEGNDGVFCTPDFINVLDFRNPSGIGLKIPKIGINAQSAFARGDSIYLGCTNLRSTGKKHPSQIQQFSLRKQRLLSTYALPESNAHSHHSSISQVWGNSSVVMGVCGLGLYVFDSLKNEGSQSHSMDYSCLQNARETIGPDDLYSPSFDYLASRILLISRDRPASWRYLS